MKIVVSGSAGTGKTTLVNHIAPTLGYEIIPEYADVVLKERGYKSFKEVSDYSEGRQIRIEALERKVKHEKETEDFISDKSVAEYFAYWLNLCSKEASKEQNDKFYKLTKNHIHTADLVIIPPFGRFEIEDNKIRTTDFYTQLKNHMLIKGLYSEMGVPWIEYSLDLDQSPENVINELGIK
jgi:predicted ATPase